MDQSLVKALSSLGLAYEEFKRKNPLDTKHENNIEILTDVCKQASLIVQITRDKPNFEAQNQARQMITLIEKVIRAVTEKLLASTQHDTALSSSLIDESEEQTLKAFSKYISSLKIKGDKKPWLFYVPQVNTLISDSVLPLLPENYIHNLRVVTKRIYLMTKLTVRHSSALRLLSLPSPPAPLDGYKTLLQRLIYTSVPSSFVSGDLTTYSTHDTAFRRLLGAESYKKFIDRVAQDSGQGIHEIRIDTFLKFILVALPEVGSENEFYSSVISVLKTILDNNKSLLELDTILSEHADWIKQLHNSRNNLFTFVRLMNFDLGTKRYRALTDRENQVLYLGYENVPDSLYSPETQELNTQYRDLAKASHVYSENYLFGPFSQVFHPRYSVGEITNHDSFKSVIQQLIAGRSVCLLGYGTSGSGKTATFINNIYDTDKRGLVSQICEKLTTYDNLEVSLVEIAQDDIDLNREDKAVYYSPKTFEKSSENEWVLTEYKNPTSIKESTVTSTGLLIASGTTLQEYLVSASTLRETKATLKNNESSRSHLLIFIRLGVGDTYLIVCDFAGTEPQLDCNSEETIKDFASLNYEAEIQAATKPYRDIELVAFPNLKKLPLSASQLVIERLMERYSAEKIISALDRLKDLVTALKNPLQKEIGIKEFTLFRQRTNDDLGSKTGTLELLGIWGGKAGDVPTGRISIIDGRGKREIIENLKNVISYIKTVDNINQLQSAKIKAQQDKEIATYDTLKQVCTQRAKEGVFINDSLSELRRFISSRMQGSPKFIDVCLPLQCNPNYESCFHSERKNTPSHGIIIQKIIHKICCPHKDCKENDCDFLDNLIFVLFSLVNLSRKDNEPPLPHIDTSSLLGEKMRLESLITQLNDPGLAISDSSPEMSVYSGYLYEIRDSPLLDPKYPGSVPDTLREIIIQQIDGIIRFAGDMTEIHELRDKLERLITTINQLNTQTVIGTLEFTDLVAKYGFNRVCNYKLKPYSEQENSIVRDSGMLITEYKNFLQDLHLGFT